MRICFPVNYVGITNGYSSSHQAIDLGWHNKQDEPILACADGVVSKIYTDETYGGGLTLSIKYDNGYSSDFKHLSKTLVKVGDNVKQMQKVAIMGNTGWASKGTHLHFNLYKDGKRVNPLKHTYLYKKQEVHEEDKNKILYYEESVETNDYQSLYEEEVKKNKLLEEKINDAINVLQKA